LPAGRLYEVLGRAFSAEQIFKDVDNVEPGEDSSSESLRRSDLVTYCWR
jgi:hypothetical protein